MLLIIGNLFSQIADSTIPSELSWIGLLLQTGSAGLVLLTVYLFLTDKKETDKISREHYNILVDRVEKLQNAFIKEFNDARKEFHETIMTIVERFDGIIRYIMEKDTNTKREGHE